MNQIKEYSSKKRTLYAPNAPPQLHHWQNTYQYVPFTFVSSRHENVDTFLIRKLLDIALPPCSLLFLLDILLLQNAILIAVQMNASSFTVNQIVGILRLFICRPFLYLLFGYPTTTFGPLLMGQPHSVNVNHCAFVNLLP